MTETSFAALPPHLHQEDLLQLESSVGWEGILPGFLNFPEPFRHCVPYVLGSLIYHPPLSASTTPAKPSVLVYGDLRLNMVLVVFPK